MTSVAGTFDFSDNDAPSPAGAGNHRLSVGSSGAVQVTDPSGVTTLLAGAWLPQLAHAGGPLAAEIGRAYLVQADGVLTFPLPANLVEGQRVAFIKNYAAAGPTLDTTGGPNLVDSVTGAMAPTEVLTGYGLNTLLEYAYSTTPAARWQLISKVVARPAIIESGSYTPTLFNQTNVSASTPYGCQWMRVGFVVTVIGHVDVDPLAAVFTELGISLPVVSFLTQAAHCVGFASGAISGGDTAAIVGDVGNNRATMSWNAVLLANTPMYFTFTYQID
jgi:hypothetical protein